MFEPDKTPTEHYIAAEEFLAKAAAESFGTEEERYYLKAAQVHATLANVPLSVLK